jgi:hypothetical protein
VQAINTLGYLRTRIFYTPERKYAYTIANHGINIFLNYFVGVIDSLETVVAFTFTDYNNIIITEFMLSVPYYWYLFGMHSNEHFFKGKY